MENNSWLAIQGVALAHLGGEGECLLHFVNFNFPIK